MKKKSMLFATLVCFFSVSIAFATPVPISNASFELSTGTQFSDPSYGTWTVGNITNWIYTGSGHWGIWSPVPNPAVFISTIPEGNSIGYLNGGSIYQQLDWQVTAANTITLSLEIGNRADSPGLTAYGVELLAGNTVLASSGSIIPSEGAFSSLVLNYTALEGDANIGSNLGIRIFSEGPQLNFDNVKLTNDRIPNPVPEPTTLLLLGAGLIGLAGFGRKRLD